MEYVRKNIRGSQARISLGKDREEPTMITITPDRDDRAKVKNEKRTMSMDTSNLTQSRRPVRRELPVQVPIPKLNFGELGEEKTDTLSPTNVLSSGENSPKEETPMTPSKIDVTTLMDPTSGMGDLAKNRESRYGSTDFISRNQSMYFQKVHSMHIKRPSNANIDVPVGHQRTATRSSFSSQISSHEEVTPREDISTDEVLLTRLEILEREANERKIIQVLITSQKAEYSKAMPIGAPILMKLLQNYDCFAQVNDGFASRIVKSIQNVLEKCTSHVDLLAYWIGNFSIFLCLIFQEFPIAQGIEENTTKREIGKIIKDDSFVGYKVVTNEIHSDEMKVETTLTEFRNEIKKLLHVAYENLLMNMYIELIPLIESCMFELDGTSPLTTLFTKYMKLLKTNWTLPDLIQEYFAQILYFIDHFILNCCLNEPKWNSMGYSITLKFNMSSIEDWMFQNKINKRILEITRDITTLLMMNKDMLLEESIIQETIPNLSKRQIGVLIANYHRDDYDPVAHVPNVVLREYPVTQNVATEAGFIIYEPIIKKYVELSSWRVIDLPQQLKELEEILRSPRRSSICDSK
jgi:hypothetical protein